MNSSKIHITVCICTYKRPQFLINLLDHLQNQVTNDLFTYSILIIDNDPKLSAKDLVDQYIKKSEIFIKYLNEKINGISHARNKAINNAEGNLLAFIDDDEYPTNMWLLYLYNTLIKFKADAVLGAVNAQFNQTPPKWVIKSKLFERPCLKSGTILSWNNTRSGNVLLKRDMFENKKNRFDPLFSQTGGEDKELFYRLIEQNFIFVWCQEAIVYEIIPQERWDVPFLLKRALMRGRGSRNYPTFKNRNIIKSLFAFLLYPIIILYSILFFQKHLLIKFLIKYCDHTGRLFAIFGFKILEKRNYYFEKGDKIDDK